MCPKCARSGRRSAISAGQSYGRRASRPVGRVLCARVSGPAAIHLGLPLPTTSCGLPASIGRAARSRRPRLPKERAALVTLLRVGFTEPPGSLRALVVSYTTVSPLPLARPRAVCFLWHCPAGHPGSALPTTLPCGARTFLAGAMAPARPPGRLARRNSKDRRPCRSSALYLPSASHWAAYPDRKEIAEADHTADRAPLHDGEVTESVEKHDLGRVLNGGVRAG